ncbi:MULTISPECIES: molybdopterin-synthase adenylyltransferase MoeB [unclassified Hyphomicrobium]|uniref:HesA/MoeB/ThiF family protein n=1 Tax=unclassified Hyphomicrobium TaxID=2619925 RepID=UPI000213F27B|nr:MULTISPECIES: molybdopterin-synthase adenylyltransferase MoeB [unclassified Hyphomicrobium]CCB67957.1 molybdopterin synthase sulfurylase [Hyphomicrobium sp. MC1]
MATLTSEEVQRYKRHLVLRDVGAPGQQKLKGARVLVIGAGGLGSPVVTYLAAAGIGTIGIVDDDTVSIDNLQRQIAHRTEDAGRLKVESARDTMLRLNPLVTVETHAERMNADNAIALISNYDIIADGSDNFATRYLVADACYFAKRPLVYATLGSFDGYVSTFKPYERNAEGEPYPTLRCLFPEAPPQGLVANCEEVGVLGPVAGVVGTLQATEVVKEILGLGESLAGRLLIYDALAARFEVVAIAWDPDNPLSGKQPTIVDLSSHRASQNSACAAE